jgi:glycosyltransferase involved in cell wall biosynthesis
MEAQSQRLAVLATNLAGIPELVIDGETGVLVPPDDAAALAQAIERLLRDRDSRARIAAAGFERVRSRFAMDRGIADLEQRFS